LPNEIVASRHDRERGIWKVRIHGRLRCPICYRDDYAEVMLSRHLWVHGNRATLIQCILDLVSRDTLTHSGEHDAAGCWLCKREAELAKAKQTRTEVEVQRCQ
jgi:hypothetical protein